MSSMQHEYCHSKSYKQIMNMVAFKKKEGKKFSPILKLIAFIRKILKIKISK